MFNTIETLKELGNTTAIYPLLDELIESQDRIDNEVIAFFNQYKTKDTTAITKVGLILWNQNQLSLNTISNNWKKDLLETMNLFWWEYEQWTEEEQNKAERIPFSLLIRLFWGLWKDEEPRIQNQCIKIFRGIDLAKFYDTIIMREGCILDPISDEIDSWYSRLISTVTEKACKNLGKRLELV